MDVMRFAGDSAVLQKMAQQMDENNARFSRLMAESDERMRQQTRRDVAAAYGQIIPFD